MVCCKFLRAQPWPGSTIFIGFVTGGRAGLKPPGFIVGLLEVASYQYARESAIHVLVPIIDSGPETSELECAEGRASQ